MSHLCLQQSLEFRVKILTSCSNRTLSFPLQYIQHYCYTVFVVYACQLQLREGRDNPYYDFILEFLHIEGTQ